MDANGNVTMDLPSRYSLEPTQVPNSKFEKSLFERKLQELRLMSAFNRKVLSGLPGEFTMEELTASIGRAAKEIPEQEQETAKGIAEQTLILARSNYEVQFKPESALTGGPPGGSTATIPTGPKTRCWRTSIRLCFRKA